MNKYPWRLRLYHEGSASLRLERPGRWFRFDATHSGTDSIHIPTGTPGAPIDGILQAIRSGERPTVAGFPADLQSLEDLGTIDGHMVPTTLDGVKISTTEFPQSSANRPPNPSLTQRIRTRLSSQKLQWNPHPRVVELELPDGGRLVHIGCALHSETPRNWIEQIAERFGGADWLIVCIPYGEGQAVLETLPLFKAQIVLVTDLINDSREQRNMPTELMTPIVDKLQDQGIAAYPFPPQSSQRFETELKKEPATTP